MRFAGGGGGMSSMSAFRTRACESDAMGVMMWGEMGERMGGFEVEEGGGDGGRE